MSCDQETFDALFGNGKPGRLAAMPYDISCENKGCDNSARVYGANIEAAKVEARNKGWRRFKMGWYCPACTANLRQSKQR
jgi:hypothetical protein